MLDSFCANSNPNVCTIAHPIVDELSNPCVGSRGVGVGASPNVDELWQLLIQMCAVIDSEYDVTTISRLLDIIGLFCRILSL